jgi:hypothetical protein
MSVGDDVYGMIARAKTSQGGNYFKDGKYTLAVERLIIEKKHKDIWFIAEMRILTAQAIDVHPSERNEDELNVALPPSPVGSTVTFMAPMGQEWGPGKAKGFLCALDDTDPAEVSDANQAGIDAFVALMKGATSKAQLLRGALISMETYRKQPKDGKRAGKWSVRERWETVKGQTPASIAAMRAQLDTAAPLAPQNAAAAS